MLSKIITIVSCLLASTALAVTIASSVVMMERGTTPPTSTRVGTLFVDTDASAIGVMKCYATGSFRTIVDFSTPSLPPKLLFMDTYYASNSGGEDNNGTYVNLYGTDFGATPTVTVGGDAVATYNQRGVNAQYAQGEQALEQITVQLGSGVGTGAVVVTAGGQTSSESHTLTVISGDVRFVDNVVGNDGTAVVNDITKPWRLAHIALSASSPGDQVVVRGTGTTWTDVEGGTTWVFIGPEEGTEGNPIIFTGYPGETVVSTGMIEHWLSDGDTIISNLKIDRLNAHPRAIGLLDVTRARVVAIAIVNCNIDSLLTGAISVPGNTSPVILGCYINNVGGNGGNHAIYVSDSTTDTTIGWCKIDGVTEGHGLNFYHNAGALENATVHDCIIRNAGYGGITVWRTTTGTYTISDCLIVGSPMAGIRVGQSATDLTIENCTISSDTGKCLRMADDDPISLTLTGNTITATGSAIMIEEGIADEKITAYSNTWSPGPDPDWEGVPP